MILPKVRDPRFVTVRRGGTLTDADHRLLALWAAGTGGGWMLADNHGEIPFPVSDDVLSTIAETVKSRGRATLSQTP